MAEEVLRIIYSIKDDIFQLRHQEFITRHWTGICLPDAAGVHAKLRCQAGQRVGLRIHTRAPQERALCLCCSHIAVDGRRLKCCRSEQCPLLRSPACGLQHKENLNLILRLAAHRHHISLIPAIFCSGRVWGSPLLCLDHRLP